MRAIQVRTCRYDSRTWRRNHCVISAISGSTEKATSASRQSIHTSTAMMPSEREHVAEHRHHAGREQLVQHVHVARHPRHQPADGIAIVEPQVEALQVPEDRHPQVEHHPLPDDLHRPGLGELEQEREQDGRRDTPRR